MDQSSHLATMRLGGHGAFAYLSVYRPDPVAVFTLDASPASGATALHGAYTTGSESNTRQGFYWRAYTSGGVFKGDGRVRNSGPRTSTSLPIRELGYGSAKLASGDLIKIYPYVPMDTKLVEASAAFNPDGEPFSDEGLHPAPIVNFGSHYAGWADSTTGVALVTGKGSTSFLVDSTSSTPVTHASGGSSGIAFHSGSVYTDANPVLEVSPGNQWLEHVGTDPDNGRVGYNYLAYMVHDDTHLPYDVFLPTPPTGDPVNGWSWVVELITAADMESIWDGALCILWVDEYIGGVDSEHKQSFRGNNDDRSHILGIGYARRDTSTGNAADGDRITFEIQSPISRLAEITSYSNVKQEKLVPAAWTDAKTLGVKRLEISLWHDYSFGQEAGFDFKVHSLFSDARYPAFYLQRSDLISQLREGAEGRKSRFVNKDRGATFELQPHPAYLSMTDRNSVTVNSTLTDDDVLGYSVTREHQDSLEIYELQGITAGASGNASVYSRFPGLSPAGGKNDTVKGRYIPDSQTSQNADAAMMGAYEQQVFIDSTNSNVKHRVGEMTLDLPGAYGYFDFDLEYMKFNYSGDLRGVDYNGFRCWLKRFQTTVNDDGEWVYQAVFQQETGAPTDAAQTYTPTDETGITTPVITPINLPTAVTPNPFGLGAGTVNIALFDATNSKIYLIDTRLATPAATVIDLALLSGWGGALSMFIQNAFAVANGVVITSTKSFKLSAFGGTQVLGTGHSFRDVGSNRSMQSERSTNGLFAVSSYQQAASGSHGVDIEVSTDSGATWTRYASAIPGTWTGVGDGYYPGCYVSAHVAGKIYTSGLTGAGVSTGAIYVSVNSGATWARLNSSTFTGLASDITIPYQDDTETTIYHGGASGSGPALFHLYKSTSSGQTNISPSYGGADYGPRAAFGIKFCDADKRSVLCCGQDNDGVGSKRGVFLSRDAGVTWTPIVTPGTSVNYIAGCFAGDSPNVIYLWGLSGAFQISRDGGATWADKSIATAGTIVNIAGVS